MSYWNNNQCMSRKNLNHPNERCIRNVVKGSDFCKYHKRDTKNRKGDKKYFEPLVKTKIKQIEKFIKIKKKCSISDLKNEYQKFYNKLNSDYVHNLLYIHDNWNEISIDNIVMIDNQYWNIDIILKVINQQLNSCDMSNSCPKFPYNPFNRQLFSVADIKELKKYKKHISKYPAANTFCNDKKIKRIHNTSLTFSKYSVAVTIRESLSAKLRFKIINNKDSQGNYIGYWVPKKTKLTTFEMLYNEYIRTPPIINIGGQFYNNPTIENLKNLMNQQPHEEDY